MSDPDDTASPQGAAIALGDESQPQSQVQTRNLTELLGGILAEQRNFAPGLYLVATPIGNAADITLRALMLLGRADLVACEDTRVSAPLLARYGIKAPLFAYHEHNAARQRPLLLEKLRQGQIVALISDAGTPLISDPGYKLVREAAEAGIAVTALPGASAVLTGLTLSGLPTDRFLFAGFPPAKDKAARDWLADLARQPATLVLLESAQRLPESLARLAEIFGPDREAAVARELTKKFEEVRRGTLAGLAAHYAEAGPPKGEVTLVIAPAETAAASFDDATLDEALAEALKTMSVSDAAAKVAELSGRKKREVYALALKRTAR